MTQAIQVIRVLLLLLGLLACVQPAVAVESVTYLHNDAAGSPVAATDAAGNVIWREGYRAYGERTRNETAARSNRQFFHGKAFDADSGLAYFGARYYDPVVGRFMAIDPAGFDEANLHSVNRYAYGNNNPYSYTDPDGRAAALIPYVVAAVRAGAQRLLTFALTRGAQASVTGAEIAAGEALGGASLAGGAAAAGARAAGEVGEVAAKGTSGQVFQRVVSNAELKATQETGLLRGGRAGENFFTDAASLDAKRAQQRLGLDGPLRDQRIEFRIANDTAVSGPRVAPGGRSGTLGGGREFSTNGPTQIEILRIDPLRR